MSIFAEFSAYMGYVLAFSIGTFFLISRGRWTRQTSRYREQISQFEKREAAQTVEITSEKQRLAEKEKQLEKQEEETRFLRNQLSRVEKEHAQLETSLEEREKKFSEQIQQLENSKEVLKREFSNLANDIFEQKGRVLTQQNTREIESLLTPFKEQMSDFRKKVESIHEKDLVQRSALQNELKNIKDLNRQMSEETQALTKALKGDKKAQGNWGELMLENVLDRSGLRKDKDYFREKSVSSKESRGRLDVLVKLPEGRHLIIDSKVSLNAYTRAINAENEQAREVAMNEHVQALHQRIKDLASKDYSGYEEVRSPDIVFMFVPMESAFMEAFKKDELLFQKAWDSGITIVTPTTLLASLKIVAQLWRLENQNKSTMALAEKARSVYEKLATFLRSMETLGTQINRAHETYDKAVNQLRSGKGNLVKQVDDFRSLGVRVTGALPEYFTEHGGGELEASEHRGRETSTF